MTSSMSLLLISFLLVLSSNPSFFLITVETQPSPPIANGLSLGFYSKSCPNLETIIRDELRNVFRDDIGQAAGLLRLHFHDCFVQGCDGSVLLDGTSSEPSEKDAPPNLSLKARAFTIINDLLARVHTACGRVVSCSDITTLAARDAVFLSGGPDYRVPLGRRDGFNFATITETLGNLPSPTANASHLITTFATNQNLDATDLVALSGGHTIGIGGCPSFQNRLFPNEDSTMDKTFLNNLKSICPVPNIDNTTVLDIRSPNVFDNKYYVDLVNRQGLFTSDQDLYSDSKTRPTVTSFARNQSLFFERFVFSMIKMSQLGVLTGTQGEIRANCSVRNPTASSSYLSSVVDAKETATYLSYVVDGGKAQHSNMATDV